MPEGERFYRAQIRLYATVDMTPREIHDLGLEQVARIRGEMQDIIEQVGFDGDFAAFLAFLRSDSRFYAKTPKELLAHASYYAKKIDGRLPLLFGRLPRQPYGVAPVPEEIAPFYTAGRYVPAVPDQTDDNRRVPPSIRWRLCRRRKYRSKPREPHRPSR